MKKTIMCWLGAIATAFSPLFTTAPISRCLLFISPVPPCSSCVWVGVSAALFSPDYPLPSNPGYFWLRPSRAIHQGRPCPTQVNWRAGRLVLRGSRLPSLPLQSGFLEPCARHARPACTATWFSPLALFFPSYLEYAVNCHSSPGLAILSADSVGSWKRCGSDVSATTSPWSLGQHACSPSLEANLFTQQIYLSLGEKGRPQD